MCFYCGWYTSNGDDDVCRPHTHAHTVNCRIFFSFIRLHPVQLSDTSFSAPQVSTEVLLKLD